MRAVWSFWSKPFSAHRNRVWASERHHLLSWILSTETAKRHYRPAVLHTDDAGARLLVDDLGLEFDAVHTSLNAIADADPAWWALGKLYTYRLQREPFVHIDNDVFLWKALPPDLESAQVFAQNAEPFVVGQSFYQPEAVEQALRAAAHGWLPREWRWYRQGSPHSRGECCGIFGGNRVDFIRHYATQAIRLVERPGNRRALAAMPDKAVHMVLVEQYLLAACIEYFRAHAEAAFHDVAISYLFSSLEQAFDSETAARRGYTHLISNAKRNPEIADRLEARVARDYPAHYQRSLVCSGKQVRPGSGGSALSAAIVAP
jgi:hypothetical protein